MSEEKSALLIFIKNPEKGKVKTRLAKDIGDDAALEIYKKLLEHTRKVTEGVDVDRFLFYSDYVVRKDNFSEPIFRKYAQCHGDLGDRMSYAFSIPFKSSYKKVVIMGSDCWSLTSQHIKDAFSALDNSDYVIGPANDGGYYLLGMKKWQRALFVDKAWSTDTVLEDTRAQIEKSGARLSLLEELNDIDNKTDLDSAIGLELS
ncbi:MAG: rSAM/selenodomain-associated transferase 1 [Limisphaerales bacterium]|jgi:rSAM/selenodomain-associated transferase 1